MNKKFLKLTITTGLAVLLIQLIFCSNGQSSPVVVESDDEITANRVCESTKIGVVTVKDGKSHGSGFIVNSEGIIVTNAHVVDGSPSVVTIVFSDGRQASADVIGFAKGGVDLAILQIYNQSNLTSLPLARSGTAKVGDRVFAIGSPLDPENQNICTSGNITKIASKNGKIIHNADTNQGNSGGPLVNTKGEVVGVNTWVAVAPVYDRSGIDVIGTTATGTGINLSQPVQFVHDLLTARQSNNLATQSTLAKNSEPPPIVTITLNSQVINGQLTNGDRIFEDGSYTDIYQFEAKRGQQLTIEMKSQDFDSVLCLYKVDLIETPDGQNINFTEVARNNDQGAGDLNAQITTVLSEDGIYQVFAKSYEGGEKGNYTLRTVTNP